jgi:hypothetical protein
VDEIVVTQVEKHRGDKDDIRDAFLRAEQLRVGDIKPVFKDKGKLTDLRAAADVYLKVRGDRVRVQNRIKALFRSRAIGTPDSSIYAKSEREQWLKKLARPYVPPAQILYTQLDAATEAKKLAKQRLIEHSHKLPIKNLGQLAATIW